MDALEINSGQYTATQAKIYNAGRILAIVWIVVGLCLSLWSGMRVTISSSELMLHIYGLVFVGRIIIGIASGLCIAIGSRPFRAFGILLAASEIYQFTPMSLQFYYLHSSSYISFGVSNFIVLFWAIIVSVSLYYSLHKTQYARLAYLATMLRITSSVIVVCSQCALSTGCMIEASRDTGIILNLILIKMPAFVANVITGYLLYKIGNAAEVAAREQNGELDKTSSEFFSSRMLAGSVVVCLLIILPYIYYYANHM